MAPDYINSTIYISSHLIVHYRINTVNGTSAQKLCIISDRKTKKVCK